MKDTDLIPKLHILKQKGLRQINKIFCVFFKSTQTPYSKTKRIKTKNSSAISFVGNEFKPHTPKQKGYNLFLNYFGNEIVNYEL